MKALVWHGDRDLRYQDVPDPEPAQDEMLLEVQLAGICGSDLHPYRGHRGPRRPPLVLGHEVVGRVGTQRYVVNPLISCGECERCVAGEENLCSDWRLLGMHQPGVFSEQIAVPRGALHAVPDEIDSHLAVLCEPLACCIGALAPLREEPSSRVVVIGCGPIGLLCVHVAAVAGATVTAIDPVAERLATARGLGAVGSDADPGSADIVVDAAGFADSWSTAISAVRKGGHVMVVGLGQAAGPFPMADVVRRGVHVSGHFAYSHADFVRALRLLGEQSLDISWLREAALADGATAFAHLVDSPEAYTKVVLRA